MTVPNYAWSKEAKEFAEENFLDTDEVNEMIFYALQKPSDSMWFDKDIYHTHGLAFSHPYLLGGYEYLATATNLEAALERFEEAGVKTDVEQYGHKNPEVTRSSFGHWSYAHFDCLKVPLLDFVDDTPTVTLAAAILGLLNDELEEYPLLDEEGYFRAERKLVEIALMEEIDSFDVSDTRKFQLFEYAQNFYGATTPDDAYTTAHLALDNMEDDYNPHANLPDTGPILHELAEDWQRLYEELSNVNQNDVCKLMDDEY